MPSTIAIIRKITELDYGVDRGMFRLPMKKAFLFYALRHLGRDTDPSPRRPQDQQIILLNGTKPSLGEKK